MGAGLIGVGRINGVTLELINKAGEQLVTVAGDAERLWSDKLLLPLTVGRTVDGEGEVESLLKSFINDKRLIAVW